jgi:hypothetical protein
VRLAAARALASVLARRAAWALVLEQALMAERALAQERELALEQALMAERALAREWVLVSEPALAPRVVALRRVLQAWEWAGAPPNAELCRSALVLARQAREDARSRPLPDCPRAAA